MGKDTKLAADTDIQLLSLLIAKFLAEEYFTGTVPAANDYELVKKDGFNHEIGEMHVGVRLGRGVVARVFTTWRDGPKHPVAWLADTARQMAEKIAEVEREGPMLRSVLSEVRSAAKREVAKAARRGLHYGLTSVDLAPVEAGTDFLNGIRVEFTALSEALRPETREFYADSKEYVVEAFSEIAVQQTNRAIRRRELDLIGATGTIDAVVVAALEAAGLDLRDVLTQLRDSEDWIVDVPRPEGGMFVLHWKDGGVRAQIQLAEGVSWHNGTLNLYNSRRDMKGLAGGTPLRKVFDHPFFAPGQTVTWGHGGKGGHASVHATEQMLAFDADTGKLWAA